MRSRLATAAARVIERRSFRASASHPEAVDSAHVVLQKWQAEVNQRLQGRTSVIDPLPEGPLLALRELLDSPTVAEPPRQALSQKRAVHPMAFYFTLHDFAEPLSRDGYSEYLTPPPPFHGRMFAGTKIDFELPMHVGDLVESATEVESVSVKEGRSGPLAFVDVARRFFARGRPGDLFVRELRTYVFRYGTSAPATTSSARARSVAPEVLAPHLQSTFTPDELALFRFSALTFNSHRIHYDLRWCVKVERFPGIVVHGPFTATMLCDLALNTYRTRVAAVRDGFPPIKSFSCRATAPLFANQSAQLAARVVQGASGATEVVMRATRLAADDEELDDEDADDGGTDGDKSQGAAEQADDLIMTAVATF